LPVKYYQVPSSTGFDHIRVKEVLLYSEQHKYSGLKSSVIYIKK